MVDVSSAVDLNALGVSNVQGIKAIAVHDSGLMVSPTHRVHYAHVCCSHGCTEKVWQGDEVRTKCGVQELDALLQTSRDATYITSLQYSLLQARD